MKADSIIELVAPKQGSAELAGVLERFARRYREILDHEMKKLDRKIQVGAEFVITQPVIAGHRNVDALDGLRMPVFVGAWMSSRLALFSDCVGYQVSADAIRCLDERR